MKYAILKQMHFLLTCEDYDSIFKLYARNKYTETAEVITERLYDYLRLCCAASYDKFCHIKGLLQAMGCAVEEYWIDALFYRAVQCHDFKKMQFYYRYGANVHAWNDVAIRFAFEASNYDLAEELIKMGADVCANNGQTRKAVIKNNDMRMAALLIEALMKKEKVRNFLHNVTVKEHSN